MIALRQANQVRSARAKLKQDLRAGEVRLEQILATPADYLANAEVFDLLVAVPKIGPVKAGRLLSIARISRSKTVDQLSGRFVKLPAFVIRTDDELAHVPCPGSLYRRPVQVVDEIPMHVEIIKLPAIDRFENDIGGRVGREADEAGASLFL